MNMKRSLAAFALMLLVTPLMAATKDEPNRAARVLAETPGLTTLADDDGGRVEVFRHGAVARQLTFHGGAGGQEPGLPIVLPGALRTPFPPQRKTALHRAV